MQWRSRTLLRLTGKPPAKAPEQKSGKATQAAILRRFFLVIEKLENSLRRTGGQDGRNGR